MHVGREVEVRAKLDVPAHFLAKRRKLEALEVHGEHVGRILNARAALRAHELLV